MLVLLPIWNNAALPHLVKITIVQLFHYFFRVFLFIFSTLSITAFLYISGTSKTSERVTIMSPWPRTSTSPLLRPRPRPTRSRCRACEWLCGEHRALGRAQCRARSRTRPRSPARRCGPACAGPRRQGGWRHGWTGPIRCLLPFDRLGRLKPRLLLEPEVVPVEHDYKIWS